MFEKLYSVVYESEGEINEYLKENINGHLESLEKNHQRYFYDLKKVETMYIDTKSILCLLWSR